jgi:linoleoyl-CoA desaturase
MATTFTPESARSLAPGLAPPSGLPDDGCPLPEASFGQQLKERVSDKLTGEILADCYTRLHRKGAIAGVWYVGSYLAVLLATGWVTGVVACLSLALSIVAVGVNIQHDANHNAFFPAGGSRRLSMANHVAGLSLNVIGGSAKRWIEGHVHLHHSSPNVVGKDFDIEISPFARLAPEQRRHPWHAYQQFYLWFVYAFTVLGIFVGDVIGTVHDAVNGNRNGRKPGPRDYLGLVCTKSLFVAGMVGLPLLLHPAWAVVAGGALVVALAGFLLGVIFQLAHAVEDTSFRLASDKAPVRWHEWQVMTCVDFCQGDGHAARMLTWYAGGLNYQTEHHLFPHLPHTAYPHIAGVVAATCEEFGVRYKVHPTLRCALRSHYRHVRTLGRPPAGDRQL